MADSVGMVVFRYDSITHARTEANHLIYAPFFSLQTPTLLPVVESLGRLPHHAGAMSGM